ncbi:hypothetical protein GCM10007216_03820 [Thalassobacillus devorans]|uniref:Uncharacterized protein n=1 Tax=Thalassobacillus devorans TaxID=279813 RepID=A0ABQ1NGG9_9BACI|nr:hypothetical protein [Thalassobacillus devorans]NIK27290.1 hypothetical protein [Thalassobacillus devorans]GGC76500.1 hypothetical protein GCM10007216_03820 [Thalassobacillus devorans]
MHYTEKLLIHELVKKYNISSEMVYKLLKESKKTSYENVKESERIAEIENLISFYINIDQEDETK